MRIDAALPRTCTNCIIYFGEISFNLHDYFQERNCGVNQEVLVPGTISDLQSQPSSFACDL